MCVNNKFAITNKNFIDTTCIDKHLKKQSPEVLPCNFIKKKLQPRGFPVKFAKFLRINILKNIYEQLLLTMLLCFEKPFLHFDYRLFLDLQKQSPGQICNFIKKETMAQVFSCEFCEISKNKFCYRTPLVATSGFNKHNTL